MHVCASSPTEAREQIDRILVIGRAFGDTWEGTITDGRGNAWSVDERGECFRLLPAPEMARKP